MSSGPLIKPSVINKLKKWQQDITTGEYRPYLTVRSVNKIGRRHWTYCKKQQRQVHLLSDGERRMYSELIYKKNTVAVFEQYALDIYETFNIASNLNIIHPRNWKTKELTVMTTDFLVQSIFESNKQENKTFLTAYTFKYFDQIYEYCNNELKTKNARTWQKFTIEREFWRQRGIDYRVVTEKDATKVQYWNKQFCQSAQDLMLNPNELTNFLNVCNKVWHQSPWLKLNDLLEQISLKLKWSEYYTKQVFKFSVLYKFLNIVEDAHLQWFRPIKLTSEFELSS